MGRIISALRRPIATVTGTVLRDVFGAVHTPDGYDFRLHHTMHPIDCSALKRGTYEKEEIQILRDHFQPDSTIIEIGSNIGVVASVAFREKLTNGGTLICVEPNPESLPALAHNMFNIRASRPGCEVRIIAAAVDAPANINAAPGEDDGRRTASFRIRSNLSSGLASVTSRRPSDRMATLPVVTLGKLVRDYAPEGASLICDAEGAEIPMILQDRAAFKNIRQIAIELHEPKLTGRPETPAHMIEEIRGLGFTPRARVSNTVYFSRPH